LSATGRAGRLPLEAEMSRTAVIAGTAVLGTVGYALAVWLAKVTEYAERDDHDRDPRARAARKERLNAQHAA